jgi:hypothetical protein
MAAVPELQETIKNNYELTNVPGIIILFMDENPKSSKITLDMFHRNPSMKKGLGKHALLTALLLLQQKLPKKTIIRLGSVPENLADKTTSKKEKQENLNSYYRKLGFTQVEDPADNMFEGNVQELIPHLQQLIAQENAGGKRKTRRKNKKKRTKRR